MTQILKLLNYSRSLNETVEREVQNNRMERNPQNLVIDYIAIKEQHKKLRMMMKTMKRRGKKVKNFEEKSCRKLLLRCFCRGAKKRLQPNEVLSHLVRSTFFSDYAIFAPKQQPIFRTPN